MGVDKAITINDDPTPPNSAATWHTSAFLEAIPACVAQIDSAGQIIATNLAWMKMDVQSGSALSEAQVGTSYLALCERIDTENVSPSVDANAKLREILAGAQDAGSFVFASHTADESRWYQVHFSSLLENGQRAILAMHFDVTKKMQTEQALFELAHFDRLTGLPNRLLFLDRLRTKLASAQRQSKRLALLFIDVDRFKTIKETFGQTSADALLQILSSRLKAFLRNSDTAGRLGEDEFALILADLNEASEAGLFARKLMAELEKPCAINGREITATHCIGISSYPDDAEDAETFLQFAESAMHQAKNAGYNNYQFFSAMINQKSVERLQLNTDLHQALANDQFELFYQPKISCINGDIVGMEALIRWRHPVHGLLAPEAFISILEETGLINSVGQWVLNEACTQLKRWIDQGLGRPTVAVNISAHQFGSDDLQAIVRKVLTTSGLPPDRLELELTESALMHNVERIISVMTALKQLGVRFSIDDFGTGYSSLSYLKRFPLDALKVDRSFVQDITANPDDASITKAVITLAHNLKLKVIAEGVETEGQLSLLLANHCDEIQGYYFSPPVPAAEMEKILANRNLLPPLRLPSAQRQRTILLVDDEENILASLRRLLRRDGYRILAANSGAAGLELLAENEVDVIISDQRMPNMTGVEFLRRVKTIHPQTIRMVLSGYTELQSITDAINEGAIYKFLTKPWEDDLLRANIEEAFRYKELADENRQLHLKIQLANKELSHANSQLLEILAEKERRIERDETTLDVAQEVLQCVPFPVLGFDNEGMVVFANIEAENVLGQGHTLLGGDVGDRLPTSLGTLIRGNDGDMTEYSSPTHQWRAVYRQLGQEKSATGRLLILLPTTEVCDK